MTKHFYPAIFHKEGGGYWAEFPGLDGCVTQGDSFEETYEMAAEALGLYLKTETGFKYPKPLDIDPHEIDADGLIVMVEFDELEYLKKVNSRAVKKTLTIPEWLNDIAVRENVNFSNALQNALMEQLHISK